MIENLFLAVLAIPTVIAQALILIALAVIAIGGPAGGITIFLGPFAIPIIYAICLMIEEGFKTAARFILITTVTMIANYGTDYTLQIIRAARGKKVRGVDLSILLFSMTGLMVSITIVVICIISLKKLENARERQMIIRAARQINLGNKK